MISKIEKKENPNKKHYQKDDLDIAYEFSSKIYKELGDYVKAIVLFGSTARKNKSKKDVDILIVIDDVSIVLSPEFMEAYKIISQKVIAEVSKKLHITTLKFGTFWELAKAGDPIAINIMRDGVPLIDSGFFEPLQMLLNQGRIRPTREAIMIYSNKAQMSIDNAKKHILSAVTDLYWAVIDAAHAALMSIGEAPPSPIHVADMVDEHFVKSGHINKKYVVIMRNFYKVSKMISYREINEITGKEYESYLKDAKEFIKFMEKFIKEN